MGDAHPPERRNCTTLCRTPLLLPWRKLQVKTSQDVGAGSFVGGRHLFIQRHTSKCMETHTNFTRTFSPCIVHGLMINGNACDNETEMPSVLPSKEALLFSHVINPLLWRNNSIGFSPVAKPQLSLSIMPNSLIGITYGERRFARVSPGVRAGVHQARITPQQMSVQLGCVICRQDV
ncbi:hypothetical protein J6590_026322 [Homalodisca vitripennis]|nr:hypothetical protein J6590_026322 [Homalodisca vitripennis]